MSSTPVSVSSLPSTRRQTNNHSSLQSIASWLDEHTFRAFAGLTSFYLLVTFALSHFKLLWLDELITFHIARLGSASAIWQALKEGADPNPPLTHLAVLGSTRLFGTATYALRLPAVVGYWTGMLSLFLFLKRRMPTTWALIGTMASMGMGGFEWSYESRSYAIFYGTTMLALYCWTLAVERSRRSKFLLLGGMTVALAAGLCSNYFSILAFLPIAIGEVVRSWLKLRLLQSEQKRLLRALDLQVWVCLGIAVLPLLFFHPLIEQSIALYSPYAWNRVTFDMTNIAYQYMVEAMLVPLGILLACCGLLWVLARPCHDCKHRLYPGWLRRLVELTAAQQQETTWPPLFESAAVFVLLLYPYFGWLLASLHGGMLSPRFVIPVCFGAAAVPIYIVFRTFGRISAAGPILLAGFLLWFMVRESYVGFCYNEQQEALYRTYAEFATVDDGKVPIAVTDNLLVLPFLYYAPSNIASRVVLPMDIKATMNRRGEASAEINLWHGRAYYGFPILPLARFQHSVVNYFLVTSEPDWLLDDLHTHHYRDDSLLIDTHTEPLYYDTPLAHAHAAIFRVYGDLHEQDADEPLHEFEVPSGPEPFKVAGELPRSISSAAAK